MAIDQRPDAFSFLLLQVAHVEMASTPDASERYFIPETTLSLLDQRIFDHIVRRVIERARTPDEFELDDEGNVHSIGSASGDDRILWSNLWWTVEDFLALVLATDDYERALANSEYAFDETGQTILHEEAAKPENERYLELMLKDKVLGNRRNELKWVLLLFSCAYDTRIERLFCKMSTVLRDELEFSGVSASKVMAIRRVLSTMLKSHVRGHSTLSDLIWVLTEAYMVTSTPVLGSAPDEPAEDAEEEDGDGKEGATPWLFDRFMSAIDEPHRPTQLILQSSYPMAPQLSLQLSQTIFRDLSGSSGNMPTPMI